MPTPVLQALLVADQIYQDQSTGKFVICGIFGTIYFQPGETPADAAPPAPKSEPGSSGTPAAAGAGGGTPSEGTVTPQNMQQLPINRLMRAGSPFAYVSMTEVQGQRMFTLRYVDLHENVELFSTQFGVDCRDPLETIQISLPLPPLPVPHEGVYALELLCDGELLGTHRVLTRKQPDA